MKTVKNYDPEDWRPPLVLLVGLGQGRADLSARVSRWLDYAEVLAGGRRHLDLFPEFKGEKILLEAPLEESLKRLKNSSERKRSAVLASGDPFFFGIGRRLVAVLGKERLVTFPNATSVQALFAALGEAWEEVTVLSLHGGLRSSSSVDWLRAVKSRAKVALLTDPNHSPGWIAQQLLDEGMTDRRLVVGEDLGLPTEMIRHLSLEAARDASFSPLNIVLITPEDPMHIPPTATSSLPIMGLPESAFEHEAGMITKMEVRAVVLAQLQLEPGLIMWDLGAGSGSVSIEAARIAAFKEIIAVEKNSERYEALERNIKGFGLPEVRAVHGRAREVLERLPDPDRVFIGGSGEDLPEVLQRVTERLRPGGRVVQTVVTLNTLETARSFWRGKPFEMNITQLQVNRSAAIADTLRFEALNPVFIISVWPK
jgi:precorrin-6B C5,15-methyltransferase / cobalt-precorrin-6B C5,C15-methyltransferase